MIVFSLQRNKLWNGSEFLVKPSSLELSSMCFAEQQVNIGSGKYKVKLIGSSLSGNGNLLYQLFNQNNEIVSKTIVFSGKSNTEISFDIELFTPGPYKIKLSRGKESIGRVSINLFNLFKVIEKQEIIIAKTMTSRQDELRTFIIIDYDSIQTPSQLSDIFLDLKDYKNCFFLLYSVNQFSENVPNNCRLFFEWSDLFDYLSLFDSKQVLYSDGNIPTDFFLDKNISASKIILSNTKSIRLSAMIF